MADARLVASTVPERQTADNQFMALRGLRDGTLVVVDFKQALIAEGRGYVVQIGTEDAPVDSTTSIDDELVWMAVDVPTGTTILPFFAQAVIGTWTTSALVNFMIEVDNAKARYSSGGTAFTPLNLRANSSNTSNCSAYVGTDVTTSGKTSGGSLELYRESLEVNVGDAADYQPKMEYIPVVCPVIVGPASVLVHHGAGTADTTSYGCIQWVEVPSNSIA
tara:strand:- start:1508 stop:2167 length:660 start_codon:yes stop_codon:yes gene_type:complete